MIQSDRDKTVIPSDWNKTSDWNNWDFSLKRKKAGFPLSSRARSLSLSVEYLAQHANIVSLIVIQLFLWICDLLLFCNLLAGQAGLVSCILMNPWLVQSNGAIVARDQCNGATGIMCKQCNCSYKQNGGAKLVYNYKRCKINLFLIYSTFQYG